MHLHHIPSAFLLKFKLSILIPFGLLTAFSLFMLTKLGIQASFVTGLPDDDPFLQKTQEIDKYFAPSDFIIISVEDNSISGKRTLGEIENISQKVRGIPEVASVISLTNIKDLVVSDEELSFKPIFDGKISDESMIRIKKALHENELFKKFLITDDERAFAIYIFPKKSADNDKLIPKLQNIVSEKYTHSLYIFGDRLLRYHIKRDTLKDLLLLGFLSLIFIYIAETAISRSYIIGLALLASSILPTVWILGLLPILGIELEVITVFVPVIIIALSTTYGIHILRYCVIDQFSDIYRTLDRATPIIVYASLTTMIGFSSLLVSKIRNLKIFGILLIIGIAFSALAALFVLPALLSKIKVERRINRPFLPNCSGGFRKSLPFMIIIFTVISLVGITRIGYDYRIGYFFKKSNPISRSINYFYDRYRGIDQLEVVIDTGEEYGLINHRLFKKIKSFTDEIDRDKNTGQVISFIDFVEWANGKMSASDAPETPKTDEEIGETLELLSSGDIGLGIDSFVDASYSMSKIIIRFGNRNVSSDKSGKILTGIEKKIGNFLDQNLPGVKYDILGIPVQNKRSLFYIIKGQLFGIALFFPILFIVLSILFRSFKWAIISIVPTALGIVYYFGLMGWLRIPLTHPTSISIAAIMGVSVDDVIYFILFFKDQLKNDSYENAIKKTRRGAGIAIVQTTTIIVFGLSVFLFSSFSTITQCGLLMALSFVLCMLVTLILIPEVILLFFNNKQREAGNNYNQD